MHVDASGLKRDNMEHKPFFIVRFRGGLGNQLFQYAAAVVYGKIHGRTFKADITGYKNPDKQKVPRGYKLENFNINVPIATEEEIRTYKYPLGILSKIWRGIKTKIFKLDYLDFHPLYFRRTINYLDGYFQSPLYYKNHEEEIRNAFTLKPEKVSECAKHILEDIHNSVSVSVHIRRGDLVTEIDASNAQGLCSLDYYEQAIGRMNGEISLMKNSIPGTKPTYFVFSDDIYWVEDHIQFPPGTRFVSKEKLEDYEELYLMSECKHNIIGNSTFSWWAAWLNRNPTKMVYVPKQWTVKNTEHPTIIPKGWIRI
ncbi:MAG: alpha-1,2-fucosyltransferase [Candidatus Taylorbacteria bacterium]|nr:alpha-1,2-fucosyltransferase [Candidatus Taylorbacteria bacterium]